MILVPIYVSLGYSVHKASTLGLFLLLVIGSLGDPGLFFVLFWDCKFSCGEKTTEPGESLRQRSGARKIAQDQLLCVKLMILGQS